jgi:hypothetical protein
LTTRAEAFRDTTKADKEYGGDKWGETERLANQVLDRVRPVGTTRGDALRRLLHKSGYGNHIEVVSFLADLGKLMAEDKPTGGAGGAGAEVTHAADKLYGKKS